MNTPSGHPYAIGNPMPDWHPARQWYIDQVRLRFAEAIGQPTCSFGDPRHQSFEMDLTEAASLITEIDVLLREVASLKSQTATDERS